MTPPTPSPEPMPTEPKLLPCPFCGSAAVLVETLRKHLAFPSEKGGGFYVDCTNENCICRIGFVCGCDYSDCGFYGSAEEAAKDWNTRAHPSRGAPAEWMRQIAEEIVYLYTGPEIPVKLADADALVSLIQRYAPACDADKPAWRTMEDAPRVRGKAILVHCSEHQNTYCVYWDDAKDAQFWRHFGGSGHDALMEHPTAWQPLPAPPAAAKEGV